ncbi:MAG: hypothetical protein U0074_15985 [Kouleothrix sp.]
MICVILAGYKERSGHVLPTESGFRSRIAHHIEFLDYTLDELNAIADYAAAQMRTISR